MRLRFLTLRFLAAGALIAHGQTPGPGSLDSALAALRAGDAEQATRIATRILESDPGALREALWIRANALQLLGRYPAAVTDYGRLVELDPAQPGFLLDLGGAAFKAGDMTASIQAFDRAAQLDRSLEPQLWQRGIAHYYAGRFDDGAQQFELHRTVNPRDVENSVWHFLCVAASEDFDAARAALIPVEGDSRVPMTEVLALFRGTGSAEDVESAADRATSAGRGGGPSFYAELYLGLFYEARGDAARSAEHIANAVRQQQPRNYMWHVARVHQELRLR